ncbi:2554_t:CDS:2, partial [Racocetra fulgida]
MLNQIANFQIYMAIQSFEDFIKLQYIEHQRRFDDKDQLLKNFEEKVKLQLADQQNKIEELITIVQQKGFDSSNNNNNRQLVNIINAKKRIYNEQSDNESIQAEVLINNTRHFYHKTHPTLVYYLY